MENQKYITLGKHTVRFGGESRYSDEPAQDIDVHVVVDYVNDTENDYESASVMALFNEDDWNIYEKGDIYTDPMFKEGVRAIVTEAGYSNSFGYSESGMQHTFYTHFDLAVNDKLREDEGNCDFDWMTLHEKNEIIELEMEIKGLDRERKRKHERLCVLKKKHNIK